MGTFTVPIEIGDLTGRQFARLESVVDTWSTYTALPSDVLAELGIRPVERRSFQLADDSIVEYQAGDARLRLEGRERIVPVVFGPVGVTPLLGATALEIFLLAADPVNQRLVPVVGLMK